MPRKFIYKVVKYATDKKIDFTTLIMLFVALSTILGPFMVNLDYLPMGWELPKVYFWQMFTIFILFVVWIRDIALILTKKKKLKITKQHGMLFVIAVIVSMSSLLSEYRRDVISTQLMNPVYGFFLSILNGASASISVKISLFGNIFRNFGLFTFLGLLLLFLNIKRFIRKDHWKILALGYIISAILQVIVAGNQFFTLAADSPELLSQGRWVFGSFGQSNFYVGHLIPGLIFSLYYLKSKDNITRMLAFISIIVIMLGALITASIWGYVAFVTALFILFSYDLLPKPMFYKAAIAVTIFGLVVMVPIYSAVLGEFPQYQFRASVWRNILDIYVTKAFETKDYMMLLMGSGFDTLGHVFLDNKKLSGGLIDRAHNIFLDVLSISGLIGLGLFVHTMGRLLRYYPRNLSNRKFIFALVGVFILIFRSMIHTNSIINIVDIMLFFTLAFSFRNNDDTAQKLP